MISFRIVITVLHSAHAPSTVHYQRDPRPITMNLGTIFRLYTEFEHECHVHNIEPSFELFKLWAETTHQFFFGTDCAFINDIAAA